MSIIAKIMAYVPKMEQQAQVHVCDHSAFITKREFEEFKSKMRMHLARIEGYNRAKVQQVKK